VCSSSSAGWTNPLWPRANDHMCTYFIDFLRLSKLSSWWAKWPFKQSFWSHLYNCLLVKSRASVGFGGKGGGVGEKRREKRAIFPLRQLPLNQLRPLRLSYELQFCCWVSSAVAAVLRKRRSLSFWSIVSCETITPFGYYLRNWGILQAYYAAT